MFHNISPTGLPSIPTSNDKKEQQNKIESAIISSINELINYKKSFLNQKLILNMENSEILELVKSLDRFFAHGLIKMDKCYWSFVRELIPGEERIDLKQRWNCSNRRELSLAWLKDSLTRRNLQFQMFGFISCSDSLKRIHYERYSCLRNLILLKRVCLFLDDIAEFEFNIEPSYVFRIEDTPIALPASISSPIDGTMSPVQSSISNNSPIASLAFGGGNLAINIIQNRKRRESAAKLSTNGSFCDIARNSYLEGLVDDLPEVDITALTAGETSVQSAKEQSYILDQMLRNKRKGFASYNSNPNFIFDDEEEENVEKENENNLIYCNPCTSNNNKNNCWIEEEEKEEENKFKKNSKKLKNILPENLFKKREDSKLRELAFLNSLAVQQENNKNNNLLKNGEIIIDDCNSSITHENDELLSQIGENETLLEGEIFLDSGEIIQLQLELCIKDGERIQRLFQIFTGHSTGQSTFRYLLITDQFVYLLATLEDENNNNKDKSNSGGGFENIKNVVISGTTTNQQQQAEFGISPANVVIEELASEAFERNFNRLVNGEPPIKFKILIALPLNYIDHLTSSVDAQILCFHSKNSKFIISSSNNSSHQLKTFFIETCSKILGKTILFTLKRTMANRIALDAAINITTNSNDSSSNSSEKQQQKEEENVKPLVLISSHSSHLTVVIKRFLSNELDKREHDILYLSLIYWQQQNLNLNRKTVVSSSLECYMYIREIYQKSWSRKSISQWQQSYLVLRGSMFYQFSDSSFKFAQRSLNLRDSIEEVCRIDLTNDEKYAFQITFSTDIAGDGLYGLQIGCPNEEIMKRWISSLSMALYVTNDNPPPVACMAILTSTHLVFAQEGVNCAVDGFMRGLCSISREECSKAEIFAIYTEFNTALMIRRNDENSSEDEWLLFRERFELDRIVGCLREKWELKINICGDVEEEKEDEEELLIKKDFEQKLVLECSQMTNLWRIMPIDSVDDSRHL